MISDQPLLGRGEPATGPVRAAAKTHSDAGSGVATEGGDPACWACLVCEECGAVISEGHRAGCSQSSTSSARTARGAMLAERGS